MRRAAALSRLRHDESKGGDDLRADDRGNAG